MVRYSYTINILEDGVIVDTFTMDSVKELYTKLKSEYPERITIPYNTFSGYYIQQEKNSEWFRIERTPIEVRPKNIRNQEYRKRVAEKLKQQELEIIELRNKLTGSM